MWLFSATNPAGVSVLRSPPESEMPPSAIWSMSQPATPLAVPVTETALPPPLRIVQPTRRLWEPPLMTTAVLRIASKVNPRIVTCEVSFRLISVGTTETNVSPDAIGAGGQKYSTPLSRSKYHSPGWSISANTLKA